MRYCVITKIAIYSNKRSASISSNETVSVCWPLHQTPCIISTILCPGWHRLPAQVWIWFSPSQPATLRHGCVSTLYQYSTQEDISASRSFLQDKFTHEQLDALCDLMNIVLIHNNFNFNGKHFRQLFGTTALAPKWHIVWLAFSWVILKNLCCPGSPRNP